MYYSSQAHIQGQRGYFVNRSCVVVDTCLSVKTSHKDYTNGRVKCARLCFSYDRPPDSVGQNRGRCSLDGQEFGFGNIVCTEIGSSPIIPRLARYQIEIRNTNSCMFASYSRRTPHWWANNSKS